MAVPKRKTSRSNTRHRRAQWKAVAPALAACTCPLRLLTPAHRECGHCHRYGATTMPPGR